MAAFDDGSDGRLGRELGALNQLIETVNETRILVGDIQRHQNDMREFIVRLEEQQKHVATQLQLQPVEASAKAAHRRLDELEHDVGGHALRLTGLETAAVASSAGASATRRVGAAAIAVTGVLCSSASVFITLVLR